jgi:hypothetical protein
MSQTLQQVIPVVISILLIIVIAIVRAKSETLAAITATMPVTIPLSLWIVYAGSAGDPLTVTNFVEGLLVTMIANIFFVVAIWIAARAQWSLVPMLIVGYAAWGVVLGLLLFVIHSLRR